VINCNILGRVGGDGEIRVLPDGTSVLNFSVASNEGKGDKETTTWVRCALFGKRAGNLAQYVTKGKLVSVSGSLSNRSYEKNGEKHTALECRVNEFEFAGGKNDGAATQDRSGTGSQADANSTDDIPF
jgi:single-strand DNA-binding protein